MRGGRNDRPPGRKYPLVTKVTERFFVDLPNSAERVEIIAIHLEMRGRNTDDFDLRELMKASKGLTGSEIEQAVIDGLFRAFAEGSDLKNKHILAAIKEIVPLSQTMKQQIEDLRNWAEGRARPASKEVEAGDFEDGEPFAAAFENLDLDSDDGEEAAAE